MHMIYRVSITEKIMLVLAKNKNEALEIAEGHDMDFEHHAEIEGPISQTEAGILGCWER